MPHLDMTVNLGAILIIVGFIATGFVTYTKATAWLSVHFARFESTLTQHARQLMLHSERMDRYEGRYVEIAGQLQRIIGRIEEQDRSPWPRNRRSTNHT